jgi:hypothetical protein
MTLILNAVTHHWVVQVADRMVTYLLDGTVKNDLANKMVLYGNEMTFSYCGLAELEGKNTDTWIADTLHGAPSTRLLDCVIHLKEQATLLFQSIGYPAKVKRHAFVGTGWAQDRPGGPHQPVICLVSNFHDKNGILPEAHDSFELFVNLLAPQNEWFGLYVGGKMPFREEDWLKRRLKRRFERGNYNPRQIATILVESIRQVSKVRPSVGSDLLVCFIPKTVVGSEVIEVWSADRRGGFMYTPKDHGRQMPASPKTPCIVFENFPAGRCDGVSYGPQIVPFAGCGIWTSGFKVGPPNVLTK